MSRVRSGTPINQSIMLGLSFGISVSLAFVIGFLTSGFLGFSVTASPLPSDETNGYLLLDEVQSLVDANYLREQPSQSEREYAAIRGMLGSLGDRYTFFVDPPVAQSESDVLAGTYGGVGIQIQRSEDGQLLLFPFDDSPAMIEGIIAGDELVAIDGDPITFEMRQDVLDQMLRGEVKDGNGVAIVVERTSDGGSEQFEFFVPFGVINVPSVVWRVLSEDMRIGYLQILRFTNRTPDELQTAIAMLRDESVQALVVDLRNNSGGLLQESVDVADLFLDGGVIVYEVNNEGEKVFEATSGSVVDDLPMVFLINQGTASAAELVAGAVGDRDRAILIGQRTFGKGTVQQIYRLSDDSSVHITSAEWFTPERYQLDEQGLEPDIAMIPDENGRDVELGEAIRQLREQLASTNDNDE
jgi:carboxyl-terminal processing protease